MSDSGHYKSRPPVQVQRDEIERGIEAAKAVEDGFKKAIDDLNRLLVDVKMNRMRQEAYLNNLTPRQEDLREHVEAAFARTDPHHPRSGRTEAGGFKLPPKKT